MWIFPKPLWAIFVLHDDRWYAWIYSFSLISIPVWASRTLLHPLGLVSWFTIFYILQVRFWPCCAFKNKAEPWVNKVRQLVQTFSRAALLMAHPGRREAYTQYVPIEGSWKTKRTRRAQPETAIKMWSLLFLHYNFNRHKTYLQQQHKRGRLCNISARSGTILGKRGHTYIEKIVNEKGSITVAREHHKTRQSNSAWGGGGETDSSCHNQQLIVQWYELYIYISHSFM